MQFTHSYLELGERFYQKINPSPVSAPHILLWNSALAKQLLVSKGLNESRDEQAQVFSGNKVLDNSQPSALAYCGHQFGQLNPQLGDGRAHLLGELIDANGKRVDVQLKGSGPTQYSRNGDGRSALAPALREYIMSEAMYYLGVPTTRSLAVVATGDTVYRDTEKPGGITARIASSHIRVGTFVYFAVHKDFESLEKLLNYSIKRHYPAVAQSENKALGFLQAVMQAQLELVVQWMRVGFVHGVMNTDNCAISGETIDYGPCAMMNAYSAATVFSSIDVQGRYAFGNQPSIALWNVTRLAESLLTLINADQKTAIDLAQDVLGMYSEQFEEAFNSMMLKKLGLSIKPEAATGLFIQQLLMKMTEQSLDYTQTFIDLLGSLTEPSLAEKLGSNLGEWYSTWREWLGDTPEQLNSAREIMMRHNPVVIPRNHHVEAVLKSCESSGKADAAEAFLSVLQQPYTQQAATSQYQDLPIETDVSYKTFCGT